MAFVPLAMPTTRSVLDDGDWAAPNFDPNIHVVIDDNEKIIFAVNYQTSNPASETHGVFCETWRAEDGT